MTNLVADTFQRVLAGEDVDAEVVRRLAREAWQEGLRHDFKSGKVLDDAKGRRRLVWEVAAFANADGGLVVIGVGEERERRSERKGPRLLDLLVADPDKPHVERLADLLRPISPMLRPFVQWREVVVDHGVAMLLAVPRSVQLVAAPGEDVGDDPGYPVRFGDGTHRCPEYLVSDLRLGRRERPEFEVEPVRAALEVGKEIPYPSKLQWSLRLTNVGLTWIDDVVMFVVFARGDTQKRAHVPRAMLEAVFIEPSVRAPSIEYRRIDAVASATARLSPMAEAQTRSEISVPFHSMSGLMSFMPTQLSWPPRDTEEVRQIRALADWRFHWRAAVCVVVPGASPRWFQVQLTYTNIGAVDAFEISPAEGRPVVGFSDEVVR